MARVSPRTLAALAATATRVIEVLATKITVEPPIGRALALVARAARGEPGLKAQLAALARQVDALAEGKRDWKTPARKDYHWAVGAVATLAATAARGADHAELVLTHLGYGLSGDEPGWVRVEAWQAAALAEAASLSAVATPKRVNAARAAAEAKHLARIAGLLGRRGALLTTSGARHHAARAGSRLALTALLKRTQAPVHASVLAFDAAFGGLMIPDAGADDDWFETDLATHVGAFACLKLGARALDGLVPIALTPSDGIAYLDRAGVAWFEDTIEDAAPGRFAANGAAAVAKLLKTAAA